MAEVEGATLRQAPILAEIADDALARLASRSTLQTLEPGEVLIPHGEVSDELHVVLEGTFTVHVPEGEAAGHSAAEIGPGEVLGELAALTGGPRTATVMATAAGRSARIPVDAFTELLDAAPEVEHELATMAHERLRRNRLISCLHGLFPDMSDDVAQAALLAVEWMSLPSGEALFRRGEPADAAYLLLSGRLRVHDEDVVDVTVPIAPSTDDEAGVPEGTDASPLTTTVGSGTTTIGEVARGEVVGEQALVEGGSRTATVFATRDSELARFPRPAFEALVAAYPAAILHVARIALDRVRHPMSLTTTTESVVTVVPAHEGVDVSGLLDAIVPTMERHRSLARVSSGRADTVLRRDGIAQEPDGSPGALRLGRWLEELEDQHELVVLEADAGPTDWTRRAVRLAEHVVIVADATDDPAPQELERWLDGPGVITHLPRRSLVLLHPDDVDLPRGTAGWLDAREIDRHHHVRGFDEQDLGRLARHLAGAAVGLALSGGGARGFGHVGAVRAMMEHGLPIDVIAGTSMGCGLGLVIALDHRSYDDLHTTSAAAFHKVLDYTLPVAGLVTGKRIARSAEDLVGDRTLEDLPIPLLGVSTDLTRSTVAVHRRGDVQRVIRASVAIPGVIPPVVIDGTLHVDGGLVDNLPMQVARDEVRTGTVIAIDVTPPEGLRAPDDYGTSVSGWRQLFDRLTPGRRAAKVPGLATTMLRSMLVASMRQRSEAVAAGVADLYLQLGRLPCGLLEFDAIERVAEAGYVAAREPLSGFAAAWRGGPTDGNGQPRHQEDELALPAAGETQPTGWGPPDTTLHLDGRGPGDA